MGLKDGNPCRYYTRFEPGNYDAILLYNNGKYIVYENIALERGVRMTVDMIEQSVRSADAASREWLKLIKFTGTVGERRIRSWYEADNSGGTVSGYIFDSKNGQARSNVRVELLVESGKRRTFSSLDGYFEYDPAGNETGSMLEIRQAEYEDMKIKIQPHAGYLIVTKRTPYEMPKMIGTGAFDPKQRLGDSGIITDYL